MSNLDKLDYKNLRVLVERLVPLEDFVEIVPFNILCPFHDNKHTPSARIYINEGIARIHCFAEHRTYSSYDYLRLIKHINPAEYLKQNYNVRDIEDMIELAEKYELFTYKDENKFKEHIHNCWVDSLEDVPTFLDNLYSSIDLES